MRTMTRRKLLSLYRRLLRAYGPQHWWPADTPFEVMVGAVLTQNTAWTNVERAIANLTAQDCLTPDGILALPPDQLAGHIRPSGYFNVKARRLRNLCQWVMDSGGLRAIRRRNTAALRAELLEVNGVGPETADDILLYAFGRPVFVIDAYTRRLLRRVEWVDEDQDYETLRAAFETVLPPDATLFNEYHALIVRHGKEQCTDSRACRHCGVEGR